MLLAHSAEDISRFHAHPDVWLMVVLLSAGYLAALRFWGPSRAPFGEPVATKRQRFSWFLGVAFLWLGADWPMHELSEDFLFSAHVVQHTLFSLVAPPLVLLGLPPWMLRGLFPAGPRFQFLKFMTRPMIALLLFNGIVLFTHWPVVVDAALGSELLHFSAHFLLVTSALLMWWVVIDPLPELARLTPPAKMFYLFLQSILPTIPASF